MPQIFVRLLPDRTFFRVLNFKKAMILAVFSFENSKFGNLPPPLIYVEYHDSRASAGRRHNNVSCARHGQLYTINPIVARALGLAVVQPTSYRQKNCIGHVTSRGMAI